MDVFGQNDITTASQYQCDFHATLIDYIDQLLSAVHDKASAGNHFHLQSVVRFKIYVGLKGHKITTSMSGLFDEYDE